MTAASTPDRMAVGVPLHRDELAAVDRAVEAAGLSRAGWVRSQLLDALVTPLPPADDGPPGRPVRHIGVTVHFRRDDGRRLVRAAEDQGETVGAWARGQIMARLAPPARDDNHQTRHGRLPPARRRRPSGKAYTAAIGLPVHADEAQRITAAAMRVGEPRSVWIRQILLAALDGVAGDNRHDGLHPRTVTVTAHVTPAEHAWVKHAATAAGITIGGWARRQVLTHLRSPD